MVVQPMHVVRQIFAGLLEHGLARPCMMSVTSATSHVDVHNVCCVQIIARLGQAINHPDSVYYWAWKNNIPVFCPAITDGSIGETQQHSTCRSCPAVRVNSLLHAIAFLLHLRCQSPTSPQLLIHGSAGKAHFCICCVPGSGDVRLACLC